MNETTNKWFIEMYYDGKTYSLKGDSGDCNVIIKHLNALIKLIDVPVESYWQPSEKEEIK